MSAEQSRAPGGVPYYFFLSYAHTPRLDEGGQDPDRWVARLFKDLREDIVNLTAVPAEHAGFMDRKMHPGTDWPRRLGEALATCRVFVPLYSPRYFLSEQCGREWLAFTRRTADHAARRGRAHGQTDYGIVPALWVPVEVARLPDAATWIQFDHQSLGIRYSKEGFYRIMKLGRYQAEYKQAVMRLAERIVAVAEHSPAAAAVPADYLSLGSAFGSEDSTKVTGRRIEITVAAPDVRSLPNGRNSFYYGHSSRDWNPYRAEATQPLADYAAELTKGLGLRPVVRTIAEADGQLGPGPPTAPGLLLVDAWEAASVPGSRRLRRFDEHSSCVSPLVPMNSDDQETMSGGERLIEGLNSCLGRMLAGVPAKYQMAGNGIPALGAFGDLLHPMVHEACRRYLEQTTARPPEGPVSERPRLSGPGYDIPGDTE